MVAKTISDAKLREYTHRAYSIAREHGFHEEAFSLQHYLMLIACEIGEMVEADRKGIRCGVESDEKREGTFLDPKTFHKCNIHYKETFEMLVKDTLEDELADVCIRIFDLFGVLGSYPRFYPDAVMEKDYDDFVRTYEGLSVCEQCYKLLCALTLAKDMFYAPYVNDLLILCFHFARLHNIDIEFHIERKMDYNELRARKHGKNY